MNDFSVKKYLIDNKMADEEGKLICTDSLPNPAWGLGPHGEYETKIYLCTLVHFFEEKGMLDNLIICLKEVGDRDYMIFIDEKERTWGCAFDWGIVVDTIKFLIPHMAGSNVSYLGSMIFFDT